MPDVCELKVGGMIYGGWTDIEIQRGLEQVSGQFSLQVTERWPGQSEPRPIRPGQAGVVTLDGEPVVTGWMDECRPGYDATNTWFNVSGRDKTADLIDCSAIFKSGQWKGASLKRIALDLLAAYGIDVVVGPRAEQRANAAIPSFRLEEGETVFDCLERAARLKAVMLWTDGRGRLVIDLPGSTKAVTALVEGENILRADVTLSWRERYSQYIVKGQARGQHNAKGVATDQVVTRHRPLIILAEDQVHSPTALQRAEWERTVRQGRANRAIIRVQSWRQAGDTGPLWVPGLRVPVTSPRLRIDAEMLIASVTYLKNANDGTVTDLEIADPRAFDLLSGIRTASLKSTRTGDKGLATGRDRKDGKKKGKKTEDWSDL
ncbi:phage baseplate assembly protein [Pseudogulbenkiania ferrooxidans]|uniref:Mu P family protein n=1 Tax=Pseudogulbenkiania ferrooxidans 2002 TaxID=279714 RepID=B9Z4Z1_9NEIS|nr:Mu P family protein [Pseudogulbenkiania ferrooxidans]EEG08223.1 Mu P family protein [Pseudogulbenkiania ferrooxidans 2002]